MKLGSLSLKYSIASYGAFAQNSGNTALWKVVSALASYAFEATSYFYK